MNIDTVARYLKYRAMADHPETPTTEARIARQRAQDMEAEHLSLRDRASKIASILAAPEGAPAQPPPPLPQGWWGSVLGIAQAAVAAGVSQVAGEVVGEVSERQSLISRGDWVIQPRICASGQVCVELRARKADVARRTTRDRMLDEFEDELLSMA